MRNTLCKAKYSRGKARRLQLSEIVFTVNAVVKLAEAEEKQQHNAIRRQHKHIIGYKRKR